MGYYTDYTVSIIDEGNDESGLIFSLLEDIKGISGYSYYDDKISDAKWYDHEVDMRKISKMDRYKNIVICLYGDGENVGDMWMKYFKNGKMQATRAKISYDDFDPSKLK